MMLPFLLLSVVALLHSFANAKCRLEENVIDNCLLQNNFNLNDSSLRILQTYGPSSLIDCVGISNAARCVQVPVGIDIDWALDDYVDGQVCLTARHALLFSALQSSCNCRAAFELLKKCPLEGRANDEYVECLCEEGFDNCHRNCLDTCANLGGPGQRRFFSLDFDDGSACVFRGASTPLACPRFSGLLATTATATATATTSRRTSTPTATPATADSTINELSATTMGTAAAIDAAEATAADDVNAEATASDGAATSQTPVDAAGDTSASTRVVPAGHSLAIFALATQLLRLLIL